MTRPAAGKSTNPVSKLPPNDLGYIESQSSLDSLSCDTEFTQESILTEPGYILELLKSSTMTAEISCPSGTFVSVNDLLESRAREFPDSVVVGVPDLDLK